ncbi:MAG TPA: GNAT family N-acetyltransferase [bacterium]|nr:GNAT family N-acetyltransferase [bacterium]
MKNSGKSESFTLLHRQDLDKDAWGRFVAANPHGTVFHTPECYEVFLGTKGYMPYACAACDRQGEIQALITPVVVSLYDGILKPLSSRALHFGGPLFSDDPEGIAALRFLLNHYTNAVRKYAIFTEFRNLTDVSGIMTTLDQLGFVFEPHVNYWQELDRSLDAIWKQMKPSARTSIRKARKEGLKILPVDDRAGISAWYKLLDDTYRRKALPLADISLFERTFDILVPAGMAKFYTGVVKDRIVGSFLILLYKKIIYIWYTADETSMRYTRPTDGFMGFLLRWGLENGYHHIDWGWAGKKDEPYGVREFKSKYGGREICYGRHVFVHKPVILAASRIAYQGLRLLRRIIPGS